jgi:hypothetical protein
MSNRIPASERTTFNKGRKPIKYRQQAAGIQPKRRTVNGVTIQTFPDQVAPRRPSVGYDDGYELGTAVDGVW